MIEVAPAFIEWDAPVEADDFGVGLIHRGKQRGAVGAEVNNRGASFLQALDHDFDVRQNVATIIFNAETSDPAIEDLNDVGASGDLGRGIFGGDVNQLLHERIPNIGGVVHHFFRVQIVARASAFDHVAGKGEGCAAKSDDGKLSGEMFGHQGDCLGNIAEIGGAVGAKLGNVGGGADGLFDDGTFSGGEVKRQAHHFEWEQEVGKNDSSVNAKKFRGGDGDFSGEFGLLANFEQRMLLANGAVFWHVASGLPHKPYGRTVDRLRPAGANEVGIGGGHRRIDRYDGPITLAFLGVSVRGRRMSCTKLSC